MKVLSMKRRLALVAAIMLLTVTTTHADDKEQAATVEDADESLDHQIYSAVRDQARAKGLRYEDDALSY